MKIEESLNVTFDETPPPFKTSPLVDNNLDKEEAIKVTQKKILENDIEDETLEINKVVTYEILYESSLCQLDIDNGPVNELMTQSIREQLTGSLLSCYKSCQGRLLASFQDDAKYEHVDQDTRSQDVKDDQDIQGKDLKILEQKPKSKDNDKGSRLKITRHKGTSLQQDKDQDKDSRT
ncbi:hypothetical protein Tco_0973722 [Tanacetum coccineum]